MIKFNGVILIILSLLLCASFAIHLKQDEADDLDVAMQKILGGSSSNNNKQVSSGNTVEDMVNAALSSKIDTKSLIQDIDDQTLD